MLVPMNSPFPSSTAGRFGRRLKRTRGAKVPVTVLTGFLGAGKTTLLKRFLESPEGAGTAVVINEFGTTAIDDALVRSSADQTVLIGNGCLCCVARTDLQDTLRGLLIERERGELPDFKRIVIETSGLADPSPILQTFSTDRALGDAFYLELVLTTADAAAGLETLQWSSEARRQAILADRIVVTKIDIAGAQDADALRARLRALNANAEIIDGVNGAVDPKSITEPGDGARNNFVAEAEHSDGIASFVLTQDAPMPWPVFSRAMDTLMAMRGPDLLRVKGFLAVDGCTGPVAVQVVQHLAHPPIELLAWPDDNRQSRVVFITKGVTEKAVRDLFQAVGGLI
jgi:G3E family GTPase